MSNRFAKASERTATRKTTTGRRKATLKDPEPLSEPVEDEANLDPFEIDMFLSQRLRYHPRQGEAKLLNQIEEAASAHCAIVLAEADQALNYFYESVREPVKAKQKDGSFGSKVIDGKVVYKRNPDGSFAEDINRLDGGKLELTIITLDRVIKEASGQLSVLHEQARIAQEVKNDEYHAAFREVISGLKDEREGHARAKTMDSRYRFLYAYLVYQRVKDKLDNLKETKKSLEFLRTRAMKSER